MPLADAEIFVRRIYEKTGRYPLLYVNWSVYQEISRRYGHNLIFHQTPLWIARFVSKLPRPSGNVWSDYTLWQFGSELNCPDDVRAKRKPMLCEPFRPYKVPGVAYDMDLNVFNGDIQALRTLFAGPKPQAPGQ